MPTTWMWAGDSTAPARNGVAELVRFRATLVLPGNEHYVDALEIAADSRYRLFVNGTLTAVGPAKPTDKNWFVDTIDINSFLRAGVNVINIEALAYPDGTAGNVSVRRSDEPSLSISGPEALTSLESWKCHRANGRTFLQGTNTLFLGLQELVDANVEPHGWLDQEFDDSTWQNPVAVQRASPDPLGILEPRPIPHMTLEPSTFTGVTRHRGEGSDWTSLLKGEPVTVGPRQRVDVDLDAGELLTAYIALETLGGQGSVVRLVAAECYEGVPIDIPWLRRKGDRTDAVNGDLFGDPDVVQIAGLGTPGHPESFQPFWFRTVRYLRISVETANEPLTLLPVKLTKTHYPLAITGSFQSSSDMDTRLWETSVRTLRNCMHETFEDCPFYEQLQYVMDTRSQALFSLHLSTDDRLIRRAIQDFAVSGDADGLTESRAPSVRPQYIPGFSLFWIFMVAEHLEYSGDRDFTRQFRDRMRSVLAFFDRSLADDGFITTPPDSPEAAGNAEMWNFVDWTAAWQSRRGVPQLGARRTSTILTFQYVAALKSAAKTAAWCGDTQDADDYLTRAAAVLAALDSSTAWDSEARYYRDSDTGKPGSQHAQVWAVLAGAIEGAAAHDLLKRAVRDPSLAPCSYAMSHSLFDALRMAGVHDLVDWQPWIDMLRVGLTTWAEDTVSNRSDCHAWGSVPLQHFPRWVLGVRPLSPGFSQVAIEPAPNRLDYASGTVPTPRGDLHVRWEQDSSGVLRVTASLPAGVEFVASPLHSKVSRSKNEETTIVTFEYAAGKVVSTLDPRESVAHL
ncbi:alpha-L-rhamnosidase-like protein [Frondihabitans sp. PhB161]|nr:alpha-L-rhamnosidase-like protein [Frondihabitans sp. PhB153]RPF08102.1 alpha-L-rhamnosidase-like protein [Frondihabitans sp. PhB161]